MTNIAALVLKSREPSRRASGGLRWGCVMAQVDLHCPSCGHEVFAVMKDGFRCAKCGAVAQPYCELGQTTEGQEPKQQAVPGKG
jgi:predicted RNA-binding Zn-ribbon protein involved in translation (DUF1610 family)